MSSILSGTGIGPGTKGCGEIGENLEKPCGVRGRISAPMEGLILDELLFVDVILLSSCLLGDYVLLIYMHRCLRKLRSLGGPA